MIDPSLTTGSQLAGATAWLKALRGQLDRAIADRDVLIRRAIAEGHSVQAVANVAGITRQQVWKITGKR